jgi:hypothetical protein
MSGNLSINVNSFTKSDVLKFLLFLCEMYLHQDQFGKREMLVRHHRSHEAKFYVSVNNHPQLSV